MTATEELLIRGGFSYRIHPDMKSDVAIAEKADPGCWSDMRVVLDRVRAGSCRARDWEAPLARNGADIGELRVTRFPRLYRLYVHAERDSDVLSLLLFGFKPNGLGGLAIQDQQIDLAAGRLLCWPQAV